MCQENKKKKCFVDMIVLAVCVLEDALSIQKDTCSASLPFLYLRCIIRLDKLGYTFVVRLVMGV